ncbi:MAG: hypothetical protein K2G67_03515 [Muribaculaceae bacterium]|nr:hypothetical protein [Muribaculaceae bacterium]
MEGAEKRWYAVRSARPVQAVDRLEQRGKETYIPIEKARLRSGTVRERPMIPKLFFLRGESAEVRSIETESRGLDTDLPPMWVYRYSRGDDVQPISDAEFRLFRLLTAPEEERCEVYRKGEFKVGDRLRVKAGPFAGYEGYARRIRRNKHIVVEIEGICAIALPYIHPDLLERIEE